MTLDEARAHINETVVYESGAGTEEGVITYVGPTWVFVRFGADQHSKACYPATLRLMAVAP